MRKPSPKTVDFCRRLIAEMAVIVCVALVLALGFNQCRGPQTRVALIDSGVWTKYAEAGDEAVMEELEGLHSITPELAYAKMQAKPVVFVDSRHIAEYNKGHIKGAVNFPYEKFSEGIDAFLDNYPPETVLIVYCDGKNCEQSELLGRELVYAGYATVYYMEPNWLSWLNGNKPVTIPSR